MCWIGTKETAVMGETAAEDITVYKVMMRNEDGLCSYVQRYRYEAGREYALGRRLHAVERGCGDFLIDVGFHSYGSECGVSVRSNICTICYAKRQCYYSLQCYSIVNLIAIVECVIPEGSVYFKNAEGEFVSNRIRITDKVVLYCDLVDENLGKIMRFQDIFAGDCVQKRQ